MTADPSPSQELVVDLLVAIAGLLGVLAATLVVFLQTLRLERFRVANDLSREITSREMIDARIETQDFLAAYRKYALDDLNGLPEFREKLKSVWIIINYYGRVFEAIEAGMGNSRALTRMIAPTFLFFHLGYFRTQLASSAWGDYSRGPERLYERFKQLAPSDDWERWLEQAGRDVLGKYASIETIQVPGLQEIEPYPAHRPLKECGAPRKPS